MPGSTVSRTRAVYSEREGALIEQARPMQMPCVEPPESQNVDLTGIKLFEDLREPNRVLPRTTRGGADGNRTRAVCLGSRSSAIELHPRAAFRRPASITKPDAARGARPLR